MPSLSVHSLMVPSYLLVSFEINDGKSKEVPPLQKLTHDFAERPQEACGLRCDIPGASRQNQLLVSAGTSFFCFTTYIRGLPLITYAPRGRGDGQFSHIFTESVCVCGGGGADSM